MGEGVCAISRMKHPASMGAAELESFLTYLAVERHVSGCKDRVTMLPDALMLQLRDQLARQCLCSANASLHSLTIHSPVTTLPQLLSR